MLIILLYQPVSYRLHSRMGTKQQFKAMINTCRKNNVRVYADAVVNHMAGNGHGMYWDHRNPSGGSCTGWLYENNSFTSERLGFLQIFILKVCLVHGKIQKH